ncbi:putative delta-60 repeat protein [Chryseobacterium sp. SORGH_AS 447]|uniref:T9SS type A sorting domain-containing protein n=1 Tax=Chryseobacterium sp. SORGH_AS_0447 TaxID=3041769 RepID=UPI002784BDBC|nr:T9SS type A sorting domain-containing protein [Chryseobacterium sp. SORGH_AS_0447]MDQ1160272.1 putative delta-60 repeat protein [Chryseobacterium sp. SORGH_AS_0447]
MKKFYFLLLLMTAHCITAQTFNLDASFGNGGYTKVYSTSLSDMVMLPDGQFMTANSSGYNIDIKKVNQNGIIDAVFGTKTISIDNVFGYQNESVKKMVLYNDKILIIGKVNANANYSLNDMFITRINLDGSLDTSFGTNGFTTVPLGQNGTTQDIVIDANGNNYILGYNMGNFMVKINANGVKDNSFGTNGILALSSFNARKLYLQNDGKFLLTGSKENVSNNMLESYLERRLPNGTYDLGFGNNGIVIMPNTSDTVVNNFEYDYSNNSILILHTAYDGVDGVFLSKIKISDGSLITGFSNGGMTPKYAFTNVNRLNMKQIAVLPNSKILVIGNASNLLVGNINTRLLLMRFNSNGTIDYSTSSNGNQIFNTTPPSTALMAENIQRLFLLNDGSLVLGYSGSSGGAGFGYSAYLTKFNGAYLGINDNTLGADQNSLILYPNPAQDNFIIQNSKSSNDNFTYKIVDVSGKIVQKGYSKFNDSVNIQSLQKGNYIIQIETKKGSRNSVKLIKN